MLQLPAPAPAEMEDWKIENWQCPFCKAVNEGPLRAMLVCQSCRLVIHLSP